jgi:hypothetical protein
MTQFMGIVMCVTFGRSHKRRHLQTIQHMLSFCHAQTPFERLGTI